MGISKQELDEAFNKTCRAVEKDVPVLLHAVGATHVDPDATALVAALTVQYMTKLVDAALECCDYQFADQKTPIPPPPSSRPSKPPPPKRAAPVYFDSELPEPKVKKPAIKHSATKEPSWWEEDERMPPPTMTDWVGAEGVDLWQGSRHPQPPNTLSFHHVLFCLCHDTYLYGRIRQAISTKKTTLVPLLTDPVVKEIVQEEATALKEQQREKHKSKAKKDTKRPGGDTSDGEDEEADEKEEEEQPQEDDRPNWPMLDGLIPVVHPNKPTS